MSPLRDNLKLKTAAAQADRQIQRSAHVVDLNLYRPPKPAQPPVPTKERQPKPNSRRNLWRKVLDERIHLRELRHPILNEQPRGWRDFPDASATGLWQAFYILVSRFFREHPLADLTVLTLLHLSAIVVVKTIFWPITYYRRQRALEELREQTRLVTPIIPFAGLQAEMANQPQAEVRRQKKLTIGWQPLPAWPARVTAFAMASLTLALGLAVGPQMWTFGKYGIRQARVTAQSGAARLMMAGEAAAAGNMTDAQAAFDTASVDFGLAKSGLGNFGLGLAKLAALLPIDSPITAAGPLIVAGDELAQAGSLMAGALAAMESDGTPLDKTESFRDSLTQALPHLDAANRQLAKVRPESLPEQYRDLFRQAQAQLPPLTADAHRAERAANLLYWALGQNEPRRYLIIFQNNAELRPTGGFIGSYAILDIKEGEVKKLEVPEGGSYDLQGSLLARLESPQPLHLINPAWEFQDANWFADFPTSAEKLTWFLEKAGGPTVDGVIALTSTMMESVLEAVGPVEMPEYNKVIDHRNFWFETQKQVELDYDKEENRPKQFIADMAPRLIDKIVTADRPTILRLATALDDSLARKEALLWFRDSQAERQAMLLDWGGQMKPSTGDYLSIVHTNIAGQKTDLMMRDKVDHSVQVQIDGSATVTLTLERTHTGMKGAMFNGVRNVDFIRFYLPYGSQLIYGEGFESPDPKLFDIAEADRVMDPDVAASQDRLSLDKMSGLRVFSESGKTVFGGWLQTDPGETVTATIVYRLPAGTVRMTESDGGLVGSLGEALGGRQAGELSASYSLLVQKQPGANPTEFTSRLDLPLGFMPAWQEPVRKEDDRGRWEYGFVLDRDTVLHTVSTAPLPAN